MTKETKKQVRELSEKLHKIYVRLGWKWTLGGKEKAIPTIKQIQKMLLEQITTVENDKDILESACGGLFARKTEDDGLVSISYGMEIDETYEI